jgi:hypothetical protein
MKRRDFLKLLILCFLKTEATATVELKRQIFTGGKEHSAIPTNVFTWLRKTGVSDAQKFRVPCKKGR